MTEVPVDVLLLVVYVATVALSGPLVLVALVIGRMKESLRVGVRYTVATVGGAVVAAVAAFAVAVSPAAAGLALVAVVAAGLVLAVLPVAIGRRMVARRTGYDDRRALRYALGGWPPALVTSLGVFFYPGETFRYNLTFLTGVPAAVAWVAFGTVVAFGPGIAGVALARYYRR